MTNSTEKKGVHTGIIEKDANGNFFCGAYLLDYKTVAAKFKIGDKITITPARPSATAVRRNTRTVSPKNIAAKTTVNSGAA